MRLECKAHLEKQKSLMWIELIMFYINLADF